MAKLMIMPWRRYCVTVIDNWTPMRFFWTRRAAQKWKDSFRSTAHLYHWQGSDWQEI